jgi:transglutaminase-like putative cysteine protease
LRFFLAIALLLPATGVVAQFTDEDPSSESAQFVRKEVVQLQVGIIVRSTGSALKGVEGTMPVPIDWPEQKVKIVDEESSPEVRRISYDIVGDTVKRMVVQIPFIRAGESSQAMVTFECTRYHIVAPEETSQYKIPKKTPPKIRKYLGASPSIETKNGKIRKLAREITRDVQGDWAKVEAMYDWVRNHVEYKNGPLKGAYQALKDGDGDCEELSSLFIAFCRVNGIPARTVWIPGHCYPEFYLVDAEGEGHWFPCQAAGTRAFGSMPEYRPILQKGDNFRVPEKKGSGTWQSS